MIGDILLKVVNGQTLTQAEKNELLNLNYIDIAKPQVRDLSQISEDLGHVRLGSVICGTGDPFDQTSGNFTGMGIFNPPITTAAGDYNLVGMNAGTLEAGISATDGKFYAGGGGVVMDASGILLDLPTDGSVSTSTIKWSSDNGVTLPVTIDAYSEGVDNNTILQTYVIAEPTRPTGKIALVAVNGDSSKAADLVLIAPPSGKSILTSGVDEIQFYVSPKIVDMLAPAYFPLHTHDGWITAESTWAYVSASSFKIVTGNFTSVFTKGTRLKWTQTTVKYGVVASSSYNAGTDTTTVTIVVNTDYTIANAAISANYFSKFASPRDWPGWFNYTSTLAWTAGTAPTGTPSTNLAMFNIVGTTCQVSIFKAGFTAGATVTAVTATLPVTASPAAQNGYGLIRAANAPNTCISYINTTANIFCASAAATAMHFSATYEW